ncbi:MAG: 6-bladed beta-propeller, partial [Spirochaetaceae bacterium]|nr:6-bladed beta-propeller [Spirochaetaceae bacterium]
MKGAKAAAVFALAARLLAAPLYAQDSGSFGADVDALNARELWRLALESYNRFAFNEAILSLEQALSYKPGDALILDWLGKAYYRSGLEDAAISSWRAALEAYPPASPEALLTGSRIEFVRNRRSFFPIMREASRYVETGFFAGKRGDNAIYGQPTAVLACPDGSVWAAAYGSNEVVRIDVNGVVRVRQRGPLAGFDRPYDIVRGLDGRLYVSEFRGGRVSVLSEGGDWLSYIGSKGLADGQLLGPAALTVDDEGYLYASEFGNKRISKFDPDGAFIAAFGARGVGVGAFPGFLCPSGIAYKNGIVYAADSVAKTVYMFDRNGSYRGILLSEGLDAPESLRFLPDGSLLVADTRRLLLVDTDSTIVKELTAPGNARIRYVGADADGNGSILAANFDENEIAVLASLNSVASGLFVQIERVVTDNFPNILLELSVQDASRRPVIGLGPSNFLLSERGYPVAAQELLGAGNAGTEADVAVLIERSPRTGAMRTDVVAALSDVAAAMRESGGTLSSVVSAGAVPVLERFDAARPAALSAAAGGAGAAGWSARWRFDLGVRLAATSLLPRAKKRAVVFISGGDLGEKAFEQYSLSELSSYLANNGVKFYCILIGSAEASA